MRISLSLLGLRRSTRWVGRRFKSGLDTGSAATEAARIAASVRSAARRLPGNYSCLVQSLATQWLLNRRGIVNGLQVGFARDEGGKIIGHAWVESHDVVLTGRAERENYLAITTPQEGRT